MTRIVVSNGVAPRAKKIIREIDLIEQGNTMGNIPNVQNLMPATLAFCPVMDRRQFAAMTGLTMDTVEAMIGRGYLPCIRIGKRSLINIALLQQRCIEADFK